MEEGALAGKSLRDLLQDLPHSFETDRPRHYRRDVAVGVDHDRAGPQRVVESSPHLGCMSHRVGHSELLDVAHPVLDRVVVRDASKDRLTFELLRQLVEVGLLAPADGSPRLPEVEHDGCAALLGQGECVPFECLEREIRRRTRLTGRFVFTWGRFVSRSGVV